MNTQKIHLLFFEGCPNVPKARENLKRALGKQGCTEEWEEVDVTSPDTPEKWRGFPSPTVLVNGVDVETKTDNAEGSSSCNWRGAPSEEVILKGLKEFGK